MIRRPPRSTLDRSSAASDVYKRQKLKSIEADINKQSNELEMLDPEERDPKQERLMQKHEKMIDSILTPEQNKKLAEIKAEIRKKNIKTNEPIAE